MSLRTVVLPIETKVREYHGKLWLGLNLAQRGYKVVLGPAVEVRAALDIIQPDIYATVKTRDKNIDNLQKLQSAGVRICVLPTEGQWAGGTMDRFTYKKDEVFEYVDCYFVWGTAYRTVLEESVNRSLDCVYVTGNPRFDLLSEPLDMIYDARAESLRDEYGEYVLFNTNFNTANPYDRVLNERSQEWIDPDGLNPEEQIRESKILHSFIHAVYSLQESSYEGDIILRPHPGEDHDTYEREFDWLSDVHVEHYGDVRSWIRGAKAVIHHNCTTGIESALLSSPVISYNPHGVKEYGMDIPRKVSDIVTNEENLINKIIDSEASTERLMESASKQELLGQYLSNTGGNGAEKVCNVVETLDLSSEKSWEQFRPTTSERLKWRVKASMVSDEATYIYRQLTGGIGDAAIGKTDQKFPGLKSSELKSDIKLFRDVTNISGVDVSPVQRTNNTFSLRPEA